MYRLILYCLFFTLFYSIKETSASLDYLNAALQLDTIYSFSNGEWARGFVKFNKGFDLPTNGTIFLNVNQAIPDRIVLNGGTIILNGDMHLASDAHFEGNGFIKTNNKSIYCTGNFYTDGTIIISDNFTLGGNNTGVITLTPPGRYIITTTSAVHVRGLDLISASSVNTFILPSGGIERITLEDSAWNQYPGTTFTFSTAHFTIIGDCALKGAQCSYNIPTTIKLEGSASLNLGDLTILSTPALQLGLADALLTLNNQSSLFFTSLSTTWNGLGSVKITSQAKISSTLAQSFITTNNSGSLILSTGAQLLLDNVHLSLA